MAEDKLETLEDVFSDPVKDDAETTEVVDETSEDTEEETDDKTEDVEVKADEEDSTSESDEPTKDEAWHLKAVKDERRKRQEAEQRAKDLAEQLEGKKEETPRTSVFEDEAKFNEEIDQRAEQRAWNDKLNMSQFLAERDLGVEVVAEKMETFKTLSADNPALVAEFQSSPSPYHKLVDIVDRHAALEEFGSAEEWRKKERAKIEAEVRKELEEKESKKDKDAKRESLTPSLANKRSSGGTEDVVEETLEDVIGQ